jgi:hypothetical protein
MKKKKDTTKAITKVTIYPYGFLDPLKMLTEAQILRSPNIDTSRHNEKEDITYA